MDDIKNTIIIDKTKYMLFFFTKNVNLPIIRIGNNKISETQLPTPLHWLIIEEQFVLVHMDDFGWNKTSNQQGLMLVQNLNTVIARPNVSPCQIRYYTTNCIQINLAFLKTFILINKFETTCDIEMTADTDELF